MRIPAWAAALALSAALTARCAPARPAGALVGRADHDSLKVTMAVDKPVVRVGQELRVTLQAYNAGIRPIRIVSPNGAPMVVSYWQYCPINGWQRMRRYPEAATFERRIRTLEPLSAETFEMTVPVAPDWPVNEEVRLSAELNGRPDARPHVTLVVLPAEGQPGQREAGAPATNDPSDTTTVP